VFFFNFPRYIRLDLKADEATTPTLLEVSSFLYDFNLIYELSRLVADPQYEGVRLSRFTLYRNGRPLDDRDRMGVQRVSHQSPLELITIIGLASGAVASMWGIVQVAERIFNWPLNRRKLRAEVEKLELENEARRATRPQVTDTRSFTARLQERQAVIIFNQIARRLEVSSIKVTELEIHVSSRSEQSQESQK
jgi:hypothetical protein